MATDNASMPFGMAVHRYSDLTADQVKKLLLRPKVNFAQVFDLVRPIIDSVRTRGDAAVVELTAKFDKAQLEESELVIDVASQPDPELDPVVQKAFDVAYANITTFHKAMKRDPIEVETMPGVQCRRVCRPIERVGIYVPGGTAVLPSTALMLGVPAQLAGCKEIVLATPPRPDGSICPEVLYCAKKCGVHKLLKAGGSQAIAAMALGTNTCPKVEKICGPGNQFVTAAKMILQNSGEAMVAIDMPAGPSEQLCIGDATSNAEFLVSDLLSQAEHGVDSQVVGVFVGDMDLAPIAKQIEEQVAELPRKAIVQEVLTKSFILQVDSKETAIDFVNRYAPEHLVVQTDDCESYADSVINAGSIFLGHYTPESVGDYASGTNHSLPTYGYARMYGGVSLDTYVKYITVQKLTPEGIQNVGPHVEQMARVEELKAHEMAVTRRLRYLSQN